MYSTFPAVASKLSSVLHFMLDYKKIESTVFQNNLKICLQI